MKEELTEIEYAERERLLELQKSKTRWLSQQEYDRLKELSIKMYKKSTTMKIEEIAKPSPTDWEQELRRLTATVDLMNKVNEEKKRIQGLYEHAIMCIGLFITLHPELRKEDLYQELLKKIKQ